MHGRGSCDWKNGAITWVKFQSPSTCPNFQGIQISLQCKLVFKAANFLYTKQSSANNLTRLFIQSGRSLIYSKTRRGPSTVPCGTLSQCSHKTIHCSDFFFIFSSDIIQHASAWHGERIFPVACIQTCYISQSGCRASLPENGIFFRDQTSDSTPSSRQFFVYS